MEIQGKTALVTGGASGLGEATVRTLVKAGGRAVIMDLAKDRGEALAAELGDAAVFCLADVTNEDQVKAAVNRAAEAFGGLDITINCAGIGIPAKVLGKEGPMPLSHFAKVIEINLIGTFNVIRLASEQIMKSEPNADGERGVIVNTASVAAFEGQIGQASYSASKAGVVGMTLPIAREFARWGIRVNTIAPGLFDTPMLAALPEPVRISLGQQVPFPSRLGRPEEYAALVKHIVENPVINGETIRLDGAIRMQAK